MAVPAAVRLGKIFSGSIEGQPRAEHQATLGKDARREQARMGNSIFYIIGVVVVVVVVLKVLGLF